MSCAKCGGTGHNSATCGRARRVAVVAPAKHKGQHTPQRQAVIDAIGARGPMTTLMIMRAGLNPQSANALYQEGWLKIGPAGFEIERLCGCGCGALPNEKHEEKLMDGYYTDPFKLRTPEQMSFILAHVWFGRWPLVVRGRPFRGVTTSRCFGPS